jgi:phage terminase small subunit
MTSPHNGSKPRLPTHLRPATRAWVASVAENYHLEPHHLRLLILAAQAWDRAEGAREAVARHGMTFTDRFGQPHLRPEITIERDGRLSFARMLRELALDQAVGAPGERPPRLGRRA